MKNSMEQIAHELESWFGRVDEASVPLNELERLLAEAYRCPTQALSHSWETSSHLIVLGPVRQPIAFMLGRIEMFGDTQTCYLGPAGIAPEARGKGLQTGLFASYRNHVHKLGLHPDVWWESPHIRGYFKHGTRFFAVSAPRHSLEDPPTWSLPIVSHIREHHYALPQDGESPFILRGAFDVYSYSDSAQAALESDRERASYPLPLQGISPQRDRLILCREGGIKPPVGIEAPPVTRLLACRSLPRVRRQ